MEVHELGALLQMQNETHFLLQELQNKQQTCKMLLGTSLSSYHGYPSESRNAALNLQKDNSKFMDSYGSDRNLQMSRSTHGTQVQAKLVRDAITAQTRLASYTKVTPGIDTPGRKSQFRLPQGIEYTQSSQLTQASNLSHDHTNPGSERYLDNGLCSDQKENVGDIFLGSDVDEDPGKVNTSVTFQDEQSMLESSEKSLSSTPKRLTMVLTETPKSILKRRKIIDDNIIVESKYPHTPTGTQTSKSTNGLNYSYSDVDYLDVAGSTTNGENPHHTDAINGSYIEEFLQDNPHNGSSRNDLDAGLNELVKDRLLLDAGNDRKNASVVVELNQRPKSYIFEAADQTLAGSSHTSPHGPDHRPQKVKSGSKVSKKTAVRTAPASDSRLWKSRDDPLLGYDWIAGVLDNESGLSSLPDDYFHDIQKFRTANKKACVGDNVMRSKLDPCRPISPELQDPGHQCLHGFTVNDRLFTEPMNSDDDGRSACPVCLISRKEPTQQSPGFVRVSIPRSTLETPYRVKPHRRRSYDATDTFALSKHCQAGYECSLPTTIPTAKNIDLKGANGIQGKQAMSLQEAENFVKSHSRASRMLGTRSSAMPPNAPRSHDVTMESSRADSDLYSRGYQTSVLLNMSHSLRYDLQDLARKKGKDYHRTPHSTNYPTF